jgi:hypothetical protein
MRWIGAGTYKSGAMWVRKFAAEEPLKLRSYIDGCRQQYRTETDPAERREIERVGKLAQAAHVKAFGATYKGKV